ncbi:hypothetical protein TURTL08_19810 [Turicimonas sp. TL08]
MKKLAAELEIGDFKDLGFLIKYFKIRIFSTFSIKLGEEYPHDGSLFWQHLPILAALPFRSFRKRHGF